MKEDPKRAVLHQVSNETNMLKLPDDDGWLNAYPKQSESSVNTRNVL
jgi:hypothetical protein